MGSSLSPILTDIVLQDIEKAALDRLPTKLPFYVRYVNNILLATSNDLLNIILETFSSFHKRLNFTMKIDKCDYINFLDVTLIVKNNVIMFDHNKKRINSGKYLNFFSNHPMEHKKDVILSLFDKILLLLYLHFHLKNIEEIH